MSLLRSPRERLGGYVQLARFIDKVRALHQGALPPDYQPNFCRGLDRLLLDFLDVPAQELIAAIGAAKTDDEVLEWVRARVSHTPAELEAWGAGVLKRGPSTPEALQHLRDALAALGQADREDIKTWVDLIDLEEGREVPHASH